MDAKALYSEFSKKAGEASVYLPSDREFRSELDVFEEYTAEERDALFGIPPKTVWENIQQFEAFNGSEILSKDAIFTPAIIKSYMAGIKAQWMTELKERIVQRDIELLRSLVVLHEKDLMNELDKTRWDEIYDMKVCLMKDTYTRKSLFSQLSETIDTGNYEKASELQIKLNSEITRITNLYRVYKRNIINL
jgi:glutamine synthetase